MGPPGEPPVNSAHQGPGAETAEDSSNVAVLDQVLWRQLTEASEPTAFFEAWLALLCRRVSGAEQGVVVTARDEQFAPAAAWPAGSSPTGTMAGALESALGSRRGAVRFDPVAIAGSPRRAAVSLPILIGDRLCAGVVIELRGADDARLRMVMRQLQWGAGWVRERLRQSEAEDERRLGARGRLALDLVAAVAEDPEAGIAFRRAVTELAMKFGCTRVALGWLHRGAIRVAAISHSAHIDRRMVLVTRIAAAMEEAIDQRAMLLFPPADDELYALHAHRVLSEAEGGTVLTIPLLQHDQFIGAVLFERPTDQPFDEPTVLTLDAVASVVGAVLDEKRRNDRWVITKLGEALVNQARRLFGPTHFGHKLAAISVAVLALAAALVTDDYTVTAETRLEGTVQRAIVASLDGYLREAPARAGDIVKKDALLAALDDRDLTFERLRLVTERQQHLQEYEKAMGARERAATNVASAQIEESEAQIKLVDIELERTRLVAPFDGFVVTGDRTQSIGAAVKRGDVLFEVAPLDGYRLLLNVDEAKIADVRVGQHGKLIAAALPYETFDFVVGRITPVTELVDGRTVFRVEAELPGASQSLRPGMKGIAKIEIDRRRLVWIWTHSLVDYLRLFLWTWLA